MDASWRRHACESRAAGRLDCGAYAKTAETRGAVGFLLNLISNSVFGAFVQGDILQILLVACLFGVALTRLGEKGQGVLRFVDALAAVFFNVISLIMRLAPIGVFGAMSFTIGSYGLGSLKNLALLLGSVYITCLLFIFVCLGLICRLCGFRILSFLRYIKEELLMVLGTSSSESVLPQIMRKLEQAGCVQPVVGLVVPTGYSFNLDGTCIYLTMAALFVGQACDIPLSFSQTLVILGVLLFTSKGAAAVSGGRFITLAATFSVIDDLPVAGLAFLLGVDRFLSEARALTNLIGNGVAAVLASKWENALDAAALDKALDGSVRASSDDADGMPE